jgi:hypothetical protein
MSRWVHCLSCLLVVGCTGEVLPADPVVAVDPPQFANTTQALASGCAAIPVAIERELMVTDLGVVEDPTRTTWSGTLATSSDGAWTFGRLMTAMAGTQDPSAFVRTWLSQWETSQPIGGFTVPARTAIRSQVITPWLTASGGTRLDLTRSPFRLLAIVYRPDLANAAAQSAGEGRFIFGVLSPTGGALPFTVILEYRLPAATPADAARWANDFHALGSMPVGSPAYDSALEALTNRFAGANVEPTRPNGSAISQVRSNEIALSSPWELREFRLTAAGALAETTVALTPDATFNDSPTLANLINANAAALKSGTFSLPPNFATGSAPTLSPFFFFWSAPGVSDNDARFMLSVNTCNGCHGGETSTSFLHVTPRQAGTTASLSGFLTGMSMRDPVVSTTTRTFGDLARRAEVLRGLLCAAAQVSFVAPGEGAEVTMGRPLTIVLATSGAFTELRVSVDGVRVTTALASPANVSLTLALPPILGLHTVVAELVDARASVIAVARRTVDVRPTTGPDFTVPSFSAPSINLLSGAPSVGSSGNAGSFTVCNQGNAAGSATVVWGTSNDAAVDFTATGPSADTRLGMEVINLVAGACATLTPLPNLAWWPVASLPLMSKSVFMAAQVIPDTSTPELSLRNNLSPVQTVLVGSGPDVVVTAIVPTSAVAANGAVFGLDVTACNRGASAATESVNVMLAADWPVMPDSPVLASGAWSLQPGACETKRLFGSWATPLSGFLAARVLSPFTEVDLGNDTFFGSRFVIGTGPQLSVQLTHAPTSSLVGRALSFGVTACNQGNVDTQATVRLMASPDATIETPATRTPASPPSNDQLVGSLAVTLPALRCVTSTVVTSAQSGATPFYAAVIDRAPVALSDLDPTDDASNVVKVLFGALPDFTISAIRPTVSPAPPSTAISVSFTGCNRGTVAGTADFALVSSRDATIDVSGGDPIVAVVPLTLGPGACSTRTFTTTTPAAEGALFLGGMVDAQNLTPELDETNNSAPVTALLVGVAPDFVVTAVTGPTSVLPGAAMTLQVQTCNRGTTAGTGNVWVGVSEDGLITTRDTMLGTVSFTLTPRQCLTKSVQVAAPIIAAGQVKVLTLGGIANFDRAAIELDATNNAFAGNTLGLGAAADPTITQVSMDGGVDGGVDAGVDVPVPVALNTTFFASVTLCNHGTVAASPRAELVISSDDVINPLPVPLTAIPGGDQRIGNGGQVVSLAANSCGTWSLMGKVPPQFPGVWRLGAVIDFDDAVRPEFSEVNNVRAGPLVSVQ